MVSIAREYDAGAVAHGCTGKGNDQVRFETAVAALAPDLAVLAPVRDWGMTREQEISYAEQHGIEVTVKSGAAYSIDHNLWGRSIEAGPLEDPWIAPTEDAYALTMAPERGLPAPHEVDHRVRGRRAGLDRRRGHRPGVADRAGGALAGAHGVGRIDMIENRLVGIKSREIYEVPAAALLLTAYAGVEELVVERDLAHTKAPLALRYAELVYNGLWFSPLRQALQAFMDEAAAAVTGDGPRAALPRLLRGRGRRAPRSLYDHALATYEQGDASARRGGRVHPRLVAADQDVAAATAETADAAYVEA